MKRYICAIAVIASLMSCGDGAEDPIESVPLATGGPSAASSTPEPLPSPSPTPAAPGCDTIVQTARTVERQIGDYRARREAAVRTAGFMRVGAALIRREVAAGADGVDELAQGLAADIEAAAEYVEGGEDTALVSQLLVIQDRRAAVEDRC